MTVSVAHVQPMLKPLIFMSTVLLVFVVSMHIGTFTHEQYTLGDIRYQKLKVAELGLLISDHLAKSFIGILKDEVNVQIQQHAPADQYGGCAGGGTDYPANVIRCMLDYARQAALSVFVLFIDLVAAYDKVVREIVFG